MGIIISHVFIRDKSELSLVPGGEGVSLHRDQAGEENASQQKPAQGQLPRAENGSWRTRETQEASLPQAGEAAPAPGLQEKGRDWDRRPMWGEEFHVEGFRGCGQEALSPGGPQCRTFWALRPP